jgi:hypothetical protein
MRGARHGSAKALRRGERTGRRGKALPTALTMGIISEKTFPIPEYIFLLFVVIYCCIFQK